MAMVTVKNVDDIRIEIVGEFRSTTVPAAFVLAVFDVFKHACTVDHNNASIYVHAVTDGKSGEDGWQASIAGDAGGVRLNPFAAVEAWPPSCLATDRSTSEEFADGPAAATAGAV